MECIDSDGSFPEYPAVGNPDDNSNSVIGIGGGKDRSGIGIGVGIDIRVGSGGIIVIVGVLSFDGVVIECPNADIDGDGNQKGYPM